MKLYSVVLFIIILNIAVGGTLIFIQSGDFLDASDGDKEYITSQLGLFGENYEKFQESAHNFSNQISGVTNALENQNLLEAAMISLNMVITCIVALINFFVAALSTVPNLIFLFLGADSEVATMISTILAVLMGVTFFQLLTSRWFTFGE